MAHILIAEDDESMRNFIAMALENAGHKTTLCADGMEAFRHLENGKNRNFDILLADIVMPGMDGIELSKKATILHPALKIMFITGFAGVAQANTGDDDKLLSKPFHLNDLVTEISAMLAT